MVNGCPICPVKGNYHEIRTHYETHLRAQPTLVINNRPCSTRLTTDVNNFYETTLSLYSVKLNEHFLLYIKKHDEKKDVIFYDKFLFDQTWSIKYFFKYELSQNNSGCLFIKVYDHI